mgnify:CR=1 FL=1
MDTNVSSVAPVPEDSQSASLHHATSGLFKGDAGTPRNLHGTLPHTLTQRSRLPHISSRLLTLLAAGLALAVLMTIAAVAALMPDSGLVTHLDARILPPSWTHPFGTDPLGRDMLTRTIKGLAVSMRVGLIASTGATLIAITLGILSALSKKLDMGIGVLIDLTMALPHLVLLILISFALGGGTKGVIIAVAISHWPGLARLVRAEFRSLRESDFVLAARSLGYSDARIIFHEILPNALPPLIVTTSVMVATAILIESALAFLGLGDPNRVSWGSLIGAGREMLRTAWFLTAFPGAMIVATVLSLNLVGDALNDALNPRLRGLS